MLLKRWLKTLLSKLNYTQTVRVGKTAFKIPVIQNMGRANLKQSDTWMLDFFTSMRLTDTSGFIDIGVNVGQTLLQFRSVSAQPYWGFEPNPSCVHYLNALISANQFKSTHIIPVGLSSKNQLGHFFIKHAADSAGTMIKELRPGYYASEDQHYIPLFKMDDLADEFKSVGCIKIDVEGAELNVIEGMVQFLKHHQAAVVCEILDAHDQASLPVMQDRARALLQIFKDLQYTAYRILHREKPIQYQVVNELHLTLWTPASIYLNDYLFWPNSRPFDLSV